MGNDAADVELWRLDCGTMEIPDLGYFSDAHAYDGQSALITNGCYLMRHDDKYLLWDMGLPRTDLNNTKRDEDGWMSHLETPIAAQLESIGLTPADVDYVAPSHYHGDHIGQADEFPGATLLMNRADVAWIRAHPESNARKRLAPWFDGRSSLVEFERDHDVFGDNSVTILATPGHTPGHSALLLRMSETGYVLLTGDLYHFAREIGRRNVSRWNVSRADTLASIERVEALIESLKPVVVVQHEPRDVAKLPAFPGAAR